MKKIKGITVFDLWSSMLWLLAFSFPLGRRITSPLMISWVVLSVGIVFYFLRRRGSWAAGKSSSDLLLLLPVAYLLWEAVGMLYTDDVLSGIHELNKRISFLLIPIVFFLAKEELVERGIKVAFNGFLTGMVVSAIISIAMGFKNSLHLIDGQWIFRTAVNDVAFERGDSFFEQATQGGNYFMGNYISPFLPTIIYYGMYLGFAIFVAFFMGKRNGRTWYYLIVLLFFVVLLFCDSRGPLVSFLFALLFGSPFLISRNTRIVYPILIFGIILTIWTSPRGSLLIKDFSRIQSELNYNSVESTALRLIVWEASIDVIRGNWVLGVGTGDMEKQILQRTQRANKLAYEEKLNSHNQYLQTFIGSGVVGLLLLCAMLAALAYQSIVKGEYLAFLFVLITAFNMLFESVLQTFQGIQFFIFFYSVLVVSLSKHDEDPFIV